MKIRILFREYKEFGSNKPLIVVPSSYNKTNEQELIKHGIKVVIYANQLLHLHIHQW